MCALLRPLNVGMVGNGFINTGWGGWDQSKHPEEEH